MNVLPFNPANAVPREDSRQSATAGSASADASRNGSFESALVKTASTSVAASPSGSQRPNHPAKSQVPPSRPARPAGTGSSRDAEKSAGSDRRSGAPRSAGTGPSAQTALRSKMSALSVESYAAENVASEGAAKDSDAGTSDQEVEDGKAGKPQTVLNESAANLAAAPAATATPMLVDLTQIVVGGVVQDFSPGNEILENAGQGNPATPSNSPSQLAGQPKAASLSLGQALVKTTTPTASGKLASASATQLAGANEIMANGELTALTAKTAASLAAAGAVESEPKKALDPSLWVPETGTSDEAVSLTSALPQTSPGGLASDQPKVRIPRSQVRTALSNSNQPSHIQTTLPSANQPSIANLAGADVGATPAVPSGESVPLENRSKGKPVFDGSVFSGPARVAGTVGLTSARGLVHAELTKPTGADLSGATQADVSSAVANGTIPESAGAGQSKLKNPIGSGLESGPQAGGLLASVGHSRSAAARVTGAAVTVPSEKMPAGSGAVSVLQPAHGKNGNSWTMESPKGPAAVSPTDAKTILQVGGEGVVGAQGLVVAGSGGHEVEAAVENATAIANKPIPTGSDLARLAPLTSAPGLIRNEISKSTEPVLGNTQNQGTFRTPTSEASPLASRFGSGTKTTGQTDQTLPLISGTSALREPSSAIAGSPQNQGASMASKSATSPLAGSSVSGTESAGQADQALPTPGRTPTPGEANSAPTILSVALGTSEKTDVVAGSSEVKLATGVEPDSAIHRKLGQPVVVTEQGSRRESKLAAVGTVPGKSISHPENRPIQPSVLAPAAGQEPRIRAEASAPIPATQESAQSTATEFPSGNGESAPVESFQAQTSTSGDHSSSFEQAENPDASGETASDQLGSNREESAEGKPASESHRDAGFNSGREIKKESFEPQVRATANSQGVEASNSSGTLAAKQVNSMALSAKSETDNVEIGKNLPVSGRNDGFVNRIEGDLRAVESREVRVEPLTNERGRSVLNANSQLGPDGVRNVERRVLESSEAGQVQAGRLVDEVWSAIENFRAVGKSEWQVKVRADHDTQLNLNLKLHENLLTVQATLESGNWEAVAPRWNELRVMLADRGVDLKPLDSGAGQSFNSGQYTNSHLGSSGSHQKETPFQFAGREDSLAGNGTARRESHKSGEPAGPKQARSNAILETWA